MQFLRYPGGKSKFILFLQEFLPTREQICGKYIEPFVGGGSVFLHIQPEKAIITDLNQELINLYRGIRNYPHKVWKIFQGFPTGKEAYYQIRDNQFSNESICFKAARILYLNRTCFKGMWRHNPSGKFNVGYGGEDRRWVINHDNITELSVIFKKAIIYQSDFENVLNRASDNDYIFLDPPYKPGEKEMLHAHYINGKFTLNDPVRLSEKLKEVSSKTSVRWLMTNTDHPDICKLYKDYKIRPIPQGGSCKIGVKTNSSREVLISNY